MDTPWYYGATTKPYGVRLALTRINEAAEACKEILLLIQQSHQQQKNRHPTYHHLLTFEDCLNHMQYP